MGRDIFGEDEEDFRDIPDEVEVNEQGQLNQSPPAQLARPNVPRRAPATRPEPVDEYDQADDSEENGEEDYTAVLSDARIRLEMGRLYDMIMNHELFEGIESDPKAIKSVQGQIRKFAKEQMEIMLGMRSAQVEMGAICPFNGLEVAILKQLAATASKGATETEEAESIAATLTPRKQTLNSIGSKSTYQKPAPKKFQPTSTPIRRKEAPVPVESEYKPLDKDPSQMSSDELLRRNQEAIERQRNKKSLPAAGTIPQPTFEQQEMLFTQRMATDAGTIGTVATIMNLMRNQKKQ